MTVLQATRDIRKVALWLGQSATQTTEIYLRADPTKKLAAIDLMTPPHVRKGQFSASVSLMDILKELGWI